MALFRVRQSGHRPAFGLKVKKALSVVVSYLWSKKAFFLGSCVWLLLCLSLSSCCYLKIYVSLRRQQAQVHGSQVNLGASLNVARYKKISSCRASVQQ